MIRTRRHRMVWVAASAAVLAGALGWFHISQWRPIRSVPPPLDSVELPGTYTDLIGRDVPFPGIQHQLHEGSRWLWVWSATEEAGGGYGPRLLVRVVRNASPLTGWLEFRRMTVRGPDLGVDFSYRSRAADEQRVRCYDALYDREGPDLHVDPSNPPAEYYCNLWSYLARFGQYRLAIYFEGVDTAMALSDFLAVVGLIEPIVAEGLR